MTGSTPRAPHRRVQAVLVVLAVPALLLGGCAEGPDRTADDRLHVITTTGLLRDMVEQVGGDRVVARSLVPDGADPRSHEPTLRSARDVARADVAVSNGALLEEGAILATLDANLRPDAAKVALAEEAVKHSAEIIPLVENADLDTIWLGVAAQGDGRERFGAERGSEVLVAATAVTGPGNVFAYLTGTFGATEVYLDSSDGFDGATGYRDDTMTLPVDAHTHLSWAFSEPGVYTLTLRAQVQVARSARPQPLDVAELTFAVGVDPSLAGRPEAAVLEAGHADVTADLTEGALTVSYDPERGSGHSHLAFRPEDVVIAVPPRALDEVPHGEAFDFLGAQGTRVHQLPQAVLGRHVHGEIDPHLWQDVQNGMAYATLLRDTLTRADPAGAAQYRARTDDYLALLRETDEHVRETLASIPEPQRYLVSTYDSYRYLAKAYDLRIAGYAAPSPAVEPSLADRRELSETIRSLGVRAVFLEPHLDARSSLLGEAATELGVAVCPIHDDGFSGAVTSYVEMMRATADSLHDCLTGAAR